MSINFLVSAIRDGIHYGFKAATNSIRYLTSFSYIGKMQEPVHTRFNSLTVTLQDPPSNLQTSNKSKDELAKKVKKQARKKALIKVVVHKSPRKSPRISKYSSKVVEKTLVKPVVSSKNYETVSAPSSTSHAEPSTSIHPEILQKINDYRSKLIPGHFLKRVSGRDYDEMVAKHEFASGSLGWTSFEFYKGNTKIRAAIGYHVKGDDIHSEILNIYAFSPGQSHGHDLLGNDTDKRGMSKRVDEFFNKYKKIF